MAGTWLSIVEGFGGMRVINGELHFNPLLPKDWECLTFTIHFRGRLIKILIRHGQIEIDPDGGESLPVVINGTKYQTTGTSPLRIVTKKQPSGEGNSTC
jgi:maltose phosphorylase